MAEYEKVERELGEPIAYGRTAEIYAWPNGQVLKLFHDWFGIENIEYEAKLARAVHASGLPVPAVGEIIRVNARNGLIYERVTGTSLWEMMSARPWNIFHVARRLAVLHVEMHASDADPNLPPQRGRLRRKIEQAQALPNRLRTRAQAALATLPDGERICHGDFHPGNVLATPGGEIVIDWIDASRGNPLADLARSSILALGAAATSQVPRPSQKIFVRLFQRLYLRRYFTLNLGGEAEYGRWLPIVAAARLSEQIPELEQWLLARAEEGLS